MILLSLLLLPCRLRHSRTAILGHGLGASGEPRSKLINNDLPRSKENRYIPGFCRRSSGNGAEISERIGGSTNRPRRSRRERGGAVNDIRRENETTPELLDGAERSALASGMTRRKNGRTRRLTANDTLHRRSFSVLRFASLRRLSSEASNSQLEKRLCTGRDNEKIFSAALQ